MKKSEIIKFSVPLHVEMPTRKKPKRKWYLNLNRYRNTHFLVLAKAKRDYADTIDIPKFKADKIRVTYWFYPKDARLTDTRNVTTIIDKFLMDAIVTRGYLPDDNYNHVCYGGDDFVEIDRVNPRVEVEIEILK